MGRSHLPQREKGMLRIVAGRFRGRRLRTPDTTRVRPTTDRMKETLFDILQFRVPGTRVADLFCGGGNLGLEAASRQARHVVFVERDREALAALRSNLASLGLVEPGDVAVVAGDAIRYLQADRTGPFGIILADPPYAAGVEDELLRALRPRHLVPGGVFVLQHRSSWTMPAPPQGLEFLRARVFGDTVFEFLQRPEEADG